MSLQIRFECPHCNQEIPLNVTDYAPGRRQLCKNCQIPARVTKTSLERFSKDLHQFFLN
jgi:transcription elongation factor Elf1